MSRDRNNGLRHSRRFARRWGKYPQFARRLIVEPLEDRRVLSTIYVDLDALGTPHNGSSWNQAYTSLQDALTAAEANDEIWVAEGTYTPTTGTNRTVSFNLKTDVALYGGFAGTETDRDQRDWLTNVTTLSGDIGALGDNSDNSYHVVYAWSVTGALLDGFTVTGGNAGGTGSHSYGGGMYNYGSSPTLTNVTFNGNSAYSGGGMYNYYFSPTLTNVTFSGNSADHSGGGMYNHSSFPTLTNVTFSSNSANNYGGGMFNGSSSSPTLTNCILWGNAAPDGREIYPPASATVTYSTVQGGWSGMGNLDLDPLFVDAANGNLRLAAGSPAIDAGNNAALPTDTADLDGDGDTAEPIPFDLDMLPRRFDVVAVADTGNGAPPVVDMGAYERNENPPVADAGGPYEQDEGSAVVFDASDSWHPDGNPLEYRWDFDSDGNWDTSWSSDPKATYTWVDDYFGIVTVQVTDGWDTDTRSTTVTVNNVPPQFTSVAVAPAEIDEGQTVILSGTFVDLVATSTRTAFREDFEAYEAGTFLAGQGGWTASTLPNADGRVYVNSGTGLSSQVADGFWNTESAKMAMVDNVFAPDGLLQDQVYRLSFDAYASLTYPPSSNAGVYFRANENLGAGWFMDGRTSTYGQPVWQFDVRGITGQSGNIQRFSNVGFDKPVTLTTVLDPIAGEVYGLADFGNGQLTETTRYPLTSQQFARVDGIIMHQDYRNWWSYRGAKFDNIVVTETGGSRDEFTLDVNWGDGNVEQFQYPAGTTSFNETHQYLDDNPSGTDQDTYTIQVSIRDDDGGTPQIADLLSWWPGENSALDAWGDNDGTIDGWVTYAPGQVGQAFSFSGRVRGTLAGFAGGDTAITTMAWFKQDATWGWPAGRGVLGVGNGDQQRHFFQRVASPESWWNSHLLGADGENRVWLGADNPTDVWWGSNAVIEVGQWYHVATSYSPQTREIKIYINGELDRTATLGAGLNLTSDFWIGNDAYGDNAFVGLIDEAKVFTRALTPEEIRGEHGFGSAVWRLPVTVNNVPPTIQSVTNDGPVDEGSPATVTITATDPAGSNDPLTYEWDFDNDGTYEQASSSNTATHTYADNGTYTVKVTVTDDDGGSDTEQFQVTVQNVDPSLSVVGNQTVAEGSLLSIPDIGTFTDPAFHDMPLNNTKTFSYSIAWDDGTAADTGGATIDAMGSRGTATQGSFNGSHICADNGTYTVVVTVTDDDGGSDTEQFQVTVTNVAPTVDAGEDVLVLEARTLVSSGSFTDPGDDLWEGTVDYGDGSGVQPLTLNADKSFALHHVYATYGTYTVTVTVMDDDGGWHSDTMQAHVGLNLTMPIEPDVAGWTMFTAFNATPGGLVVFVLGVQPGAGQVKVKGQSPVEVEIQAPKVVAQAVVDSSGKAVAMIDLFKYADQTVYLQAFEQKPVRQISDRMTIDVPPLPTLEIADEKVDESAGSITFTVTLKLASDREVRVNYATANGTAGSRYDYTTKRGTLKIPAGATSGQIIVPIKNDTKHEEPEVFYVNLSRPKNATLADNQATGTIWDDDPVALRLAAAAGRRTAADALSAAQLAAVTDEAIRRWAAAVGDDAVAGLYAVNWELADLPDNLLGRASANTVSIDRDAAGRGWFVDASPWNDDEFLTTHAADELRARRGGAAADRVDLLTAVMHELGHVLGLPDVTGRSDDLMSDSLGLGLRRLP